jgi:hypothetical protein
MTVSGIVTAIGAVLTTNGERAAVPSSARTVPSAAPADSARPQRKPEHPSAVGMPNWVPRSRTKVLSTDQ